VQTGRFETGRERNRGLAHAGQVLKRTKRGSEHIGQCPGIRPGKTPLPRWKLRKQQPSTNRTQQVFFRFSGEKLAELLEYRFACPDATPADSHTGTSAIALRTDHPPNLPQFDIPAGSPRIFFQKSNQIHSDNSCCTKKSACSIRFANPILLELPMNNPRERRTRFCRDAVAPTPHLSAM
jgi:hypothetical protein